MIRSFFKDSAIYMVPSILMYGTNFFLLPLYTRVLSVADYGALDMLKVFESLALLVVAFEVSQGLARYFIEEESHEKRIAYASTALWFTVLCFSVFLTICFVFSSSLALIVLTTSGLDQEFKVGAIYIAVNGIYLLTMTQLRFELRSLDYAKVSVATFSTTAVTSISLAYFFDWGLMGMIVGLLVGSFTGLVLAFIKLRNSYYFGFDIGILRKMLFFSLPLVPSAAAVFISGYVDRMMISHFLSLEEVGLYGMGFRVAAIVSLLLVGFNRALVPLIYKHHKEEDSPQKIADLFRFFMAFALLFFLGLSIFAQDILWLLTNPEFYPAKNIVVFLVSAILFSQIYMFAPGTAIAEKTRIIMWISVGSAVLNGLLNLIMIPWLGYIGAAIATMASHFIVCLINIKVSQRYYPIPFDWVKIWSAAAAVASLYGVSLYIEFGTSSAFVMKGILMVLASVVIVWSRLIAFSEISKSVTVVKGLFTPQR
jgi:O-antigen/teichoic acid export membrane protein